MRYQFETPTKHIIPQPGDRRAFGHGSIVELDEEKAAAIVKAIKGFDADPCLVRVADDTPTTAVAPVVDVDVERQPQRSVEQRKVANVREPGKAAPTAKPTVAPTAKPTAKGGPTVPPPRGEAKAEG